MPDLRLSKARATLPSGYQFGDGNGEKWSIAEVFRAVGHTIYAKGRTGPMDCGRVTACALIDAADKILGQAT